MSGCRGKNEAFTLIELLVVIAIIALLLSILMPSLSKAKKMAQYVVCSSNLHQLAIGLTNFSAENDNKYMPRGAGYPALVYHTEGVEPDMREMLVEYVAYKQGDVMFCPAARSTDSARGGTKPGASSNLGVLTERQRYWSEFFWLGDGWYGGNPAAYRIGYNLFAGLTGDSNYGPAADYDWQYSGNGFKANEPRISGSSKDCIAADIQEAWPNVTGWGWEGHPYMSNHAQGWIASNAGTAGAGEEPDIEFVNSNAAYGDGHVERHKELEYGIRRLNVAGDPSSHDGLFEY